MGRLISERGGRNGGPLWAAICADGKAQHDASREVGDGLLRVGTALSVASYR